MLYATFQIACALAYERATTVTLERHFSVMAFFTVYQFCIQGQYGFDINLPFEKVDKVVLKREREHRNAHDCWQELCKWRWDQRP
jgi:hypothetical protein